jgi:hypothetical protein
MSRRRQEWRRRDGVQEAETLLRLTIPAEKSVSDFPHPWHARKRECKENKKAEKRDVRVSFRPRF